MNARETLEAMVSTDQGDMTVWSSDEVQYALGAYRLEVIAERDAQIIAWLEKKAREEGFSNRENRARADVLYRMANKLSRGAVRPPLSKGLEPEPVDAVLRALEPVERLALAFENTGEPEIGRQIRSAIKAGNATP